MEKYIIIGEYEDNSLTYVSNINPICWVNEESLAKSYDYAIDAIHDILYEYQTFKITVLGTKVSYISILNTNSRKITPIIDSVGNILIEDD